MGIDLDDEVDLRDKDARRLVSFLRRIENLSAGVRQSEFLKKGIDGLTGLQESIFRLQVNLQAEISRAKKLGLKDPAHLQYMEELRRARKLARKLGDAMAWTVMLLNRQVLHSLRGNDAVPIPPTFTESHQATFAFVRSMTSPEWGIPIVHDITEILRVGDVTFVRPTGERDPLADYRTLELKVSPGVPVEEDDGQGRQVQVQIQVVSREAMPHPAHVPTTPVAENAEPRRPRRPDRRIDKQVARMEVAFAGKNAKLHEVTKVGDKHVFTVESQDDPEPQWALLRRAIRVARHEGNASFSLDGFVAYTVVYNPKRLTGVDFQSQSLVEELQASVLDPNLKSRNSLTVQFITEPHDDDERDPELSMPYFLWEIPRRAIRDLVRYRMAVVAVYNMGKLEELIEAEGMEVRPAPAGSDPRDFEVVVPLLWKDGAGEYHVPAPWSDMALAVREFRGPGAVLSRLRAARDMTQHVSLEDFMAQFKAANVE